MLKGNIEGVSIVSIVQLCSQEKKSGCLSFYKESAKIGEIYFKNGEVIAAYTDNIKGTEAFYRLINLKKGEFIFQNHVSLPQREIYHPCEYLILEAARYEDEIREQLKKLLKKIQQCAKIKKLEQLSPFEQNMLLLLFHCGRLLEAGNIECVWMKNDENTFLFLSIKGKLFKLTLDTQAILEEIFSQISPGEE